MRRLETYIGMDGIAISIPFRCYLKIRRSYFTVFAVYLFLIIFVLLMKFFFWGNSFFLDKYNIDISRRMLFNWSVICFLKFLPNETDRARKCRKQVDDSIKQIKNTISFTHILSKKFLISFHYFTPLERHKTLKIYCRYQRIFSYKNSFNACNEFSFFS